MSKMNERTEELQSKIDWQEQYSRRNCMVIYGIIENKEENTVQKATDFINDNLEIKIDNIDVDRSYWIGHYDKTKRKARAITIECASYNLRSKWFCEKRK